MVKAGKQMTIFELPMMLTIHLKRFAFDLQRGYMRKIMSKVEYPSTLDMAPYVSKEKHIKKALYNLYAVLVHLGYGCDSGHYFAYVKAPNGQWYRADDEDITPVSEKEVLDQNAYMLFYQQDKVITTEPTPKQKEKSPSPPPAIQEPPSEAVPGRSVLSDIKNKKKEKRRVVFEPVIVSDNPNAWVVQSSHKPHRSLRGNFSPPTYAANVQDETSWLTSTRDEFKKRQAEKKKRRIRAKLAARKSRWNVSSS